MNAADKLEYVAGRLDILDCINRYSRGVDRLDRDALHSAFHSDATLDYATFVGDPAGFEEYFYDLHRRQHANTQHIIANHTCEMNGNTAHTETYFIFASNNLQGTPFTLSGGRYVDRFECRNGRWAIAARKCVVEWSATPGGVVHAGMAEAFAAVGKQRRDKEDLSYDRPLSVAANRLGTRIRF